MQTFETEHYLLHYGAGTLAERDIEKIAALREGLLLSHLRGAGSYAGFQDRVLPLRFAGGCRTHLRRRRTPCNGLPTCRTASMPCITTLSSASASTEDTHLISFVHNRPVCPAVTEGLAMYFDRKWWGIENLDWTGYYLKTGRYLPMDRLLEQEFFSSRTAAPSPTPSRALSPTGFTVYGRERYGEMYSQPNRCRHGTGVGESSGGAERGF